MRPRRIEKKKLRASKLEARRGSDQESWPRPGDCFSRLCFSRLIQGGADFGEDLVDGDGEDALLLLFDAGLQAATGTLDAVVEDAVGGAVGKPLAGNVARGEDGDAGCADGGGEVHRAAVMADEKTGAGEGGGGFARGEAAAEVDDGASAVRSNLRRRSR